MFLTIGRVLLWIFMWPVLLASLIGVSPDMMFVAWIINVIWIALIAIFK